MGRRRITTRNTHFIPHSPDAKDDAMSLEADSPIARRYFRQSLIIIFLAFCVMLFSFITAFFLAVRGAERTVVPQIVDLELAEALIALQERELYPRLLAKYTGNPADKGLIIDQSPQPGLYVKAGRRIAVTVSKGAIIDNVEEYVGRTLNEVRGRLATLFSTYEPLLTIREPVVYVYDEAPEGTVISQTPKAGDPLSAPKELILIVSRGNSDTPIQISDWKNWNTDEALQSVSNLPLTFQFIQDAVVPQGKEPQITSQEPQPGNSVMPGSLLTLFYRPPAQIQENFQYGLFEHFLPNYPIPVLVEAIVYAPGGEEEKLFSMPYPGGIISFPYVLPVGSSIILMVNDTEVYRKEVS